MGRSIIMALGVTLAFIASCATVSGLSEYEAVDCPGGCDAGPEPQTAPSPDAQAGPPACDPATSVECMPLPVGWSLVAMAESPEAGVAPACPPGLAAPSDVGEAPTARTDACTCDACNVTQNATCAGALGNFFGTSCASSNPAHHQNNPYGACNTDMYTLDRTGGTRRFVMPAASGGACASAPAKHVDRVDFAKRARLCADVSRCSGGVCDASMTAPFRACVAAAGDVACPAGFVEKHVVGEAAELDCAATCTCTVTRGTCTGTVNHYTDDKCTTGLVAVPADGVCRTPGFVGAYLSYRVIANVTTGCTTAGTSAPSNVRLADPRTVCCRP